MNIRKATLDDVMSIVKIHQAAFENFFLSSLGSRFLKLYYRSFIEGRSGVVYCATKNDEVVGFSACSYISRGFNAFLIKTNIIAYGIETLVLFFTKPRALIRLVKNLNKEKSNASVDDNGQYAELYSIAVNPLCQGEGIGRMLLTETEKNVKEHSVFISLTTDYYKNDKTIAFYHALGYEDYYEFITYPNRRMWRLIKKL